MSEQVFQEDLIAGEQILWTGQPDPSIVFAPRDIFLVPFSLLWGGFAVFWEASALGLTASTNGREAPVFFALWGIPFVLVGLYMIAGRFFYKTWRKKRTWYAVTNRRVLIVSIANGRKAQTMEIKSIPSINKSVRTNGVGSLEFGSFAPQFAMYQNSGMDFFGGMAGGGVPAFYDIKEVNQVHELINQQRDDTRS